MFGDIPMNVRRQCGKSGSLRRLSAAERWSFYIFSSGGSLNQLRLAEFEVKGIEHRSWLRYFFA